MEVEVVRAGAMVAVMVAVAVAVVVVVMVVVAVAARVVARVVVVMVRAMAGISICMFLIAGCRAPPSLCRYIYDRTQLAPRVLTNLEHWHEHWHQRRSSRHAKSNTESEC